MCIGQSDEVWSVKLECKEVILVRYTGLVITVERCIVEYEFSEVGDGFYAIGGVIPVALPVITDWDGFLTFKARTVEIVI